jgi:hypothetical protein
MLVKCVNRCDAIPIPNVVNDVCALMLLMHQSMVDVRCLDDWSPILIKIFPRKN